MFSKLTRAVGLFALVGPTIGASPDWPPLPSRGFISGRTAQTADIQNGDAVFVAAANGKVIGKPIPIPIPQYAYLRAAHAHVIVVQAEEANGTRIFGVRGLDGEESAVTDSDIELLGIEMPRQ